ncbi:MAG: hypothetical protein IT158_29925 [Bryobacterales bacterium]|nr:hypothetical protein [Bryobacterales bacterium]
MDVRARAAERTNGCGCAHARQAAAPAAELEIVGADNRAIVADTKKVPFRWVCSLEVYFENPDNRKEFIRWPATGTLIGEKHVLTCGHALINDIKGTRGTTRRMKAKRITVIPGRWGTGRTAAEQMPFGSSETAALDVPKEWKDFLDPVYDYGLIKLKERLGRGALGYWGGPASRPATKIRAVKAAGVRGKAVYTAGYPADKCGHLPQTGSAPDWTVNPCQNRAATQWSARGTVLSTRGAGTLLHDLDTAGSQSGSPIWIEDSKSGQLELVAIHTGYEDKGVSNRAVILTEDVLRQVQKWM